VGIPDFSPLSNDQFLVIFEGVLFWALFFFLPETQFPRVAQASSPQAASIRSPSNEDRPEFAKQNESTSLDEAHIAVPTKKTFTQQLSPWSGINPNGQKTNYFWLFCRQWPLIFYPAVAFSTLAFGLSVSDTLLIVNTAALTFEYPPYNMSAGIFSLAHLPLMIGAAIGAAYAGFGIDLYAKSRSRKNNGIFEPESRLVLLIAPALIVPAGLFM
jgi:hypothetical protein